VIISFLRHDELQAENVVLPTKPTLVCPKFDKVTPSTVSKLPTWQRCHSLQYQFSLDAWLSGS